MKALYGHGSAYLAATVAQAMASALALPFLTRLVDLEEFGRLTIALVVSQLLGQVLALGLAGALPHELFKASGLAGARGIVGGAVVMAIALASLLDASGSTWSGWLGLGSYTTEMRLAVWAAAALAAGNTALSLVQLQEGVIVAVAILLVQSAVAPAIGIALASTHRSGAAYVMGLLVGYTAAALVGLMHAGVNANLFRDGQLRRRSLRIGLPIVPHLAAVYVLAVGDRFVIQQLQGPGDVGRYHVAYLVGTLGLSGLLAVNRAWQPIVFRAEELRRPDTLALTTATLYRLSAWGTAALVVVAPLFLRLLAPSEYLDDDLHLTTVLLALAALSYLAYLANVSIVQLEGRTLRVAASTIVAALLNIGLNFLLVPVLGLPGAALSTIGAYVALAAMVKLARSELSAVPWVRGSALRAWALSIGFGCLGILVPTGAWTVPARVGMAVACVVPIVRLVATQREWPSATLSARRHG